VLHLTTVDMSLRLLLFDQLRAIRDAGYDVETMSAPGPWLEELDGEGMRHIPWRSVTRAWRPVADLRALAELARVLRREPFDIVHTHTPKAGVLGRVAARLAGVPCVVNTVHGYYATRNDGLARRIAVLGLERLVARCSDLELFQSAEDFDWALETRTVHAEKARLLGNGIDLKRFALPKRSDAGVAALRRQLGFAVGTLVVTMVGRIGVQKGCREFIEAAARIRSGRTDVGFLMVGGPDVGKADLLSEAELHAAREHVVLAGWRDDLPELLALTDVFVLPSRGPEGMPRAAMEAAAAGRAMVLTDIRGCREVGRPGREALLVPPRRPAELASAIRTLLEDPGLRRRLGEAARARACEQFDEQQVFRKVIHEYRRLLEERHPSPSGSF